ncbi:potassium channel family protein [Leptospira sp. 201903070]|uniref:Potassium channel family protein n=1 Tax=Leptospira ainlahdjerensis TaxID=2810033 RepID=A0ABS2U792_9LEPT|nr:potassium channel family protein [Leptospira ainlahdjerensis]MBM9576228.1 potassium channel family protein [Leptospira ainlahdjerensis]
MENKTQRQFPFALIDLAVVVLSIYVLLTLLISSFVKMDSELEKLLNLIDNLICVFFIFEFFYKLFTAESKLTYLKWGWIDLLSSIPTLDYFRAGRLFRLIRLIRILRALRSTKHLINFIFKNKAQGTFSSVALIAFIIIIFSSIAILQVENDPSSNIKTAEDALWWSYTTVTTVGYGDKFPVTGEGRLIATILMTAGVGLFGTFTGFVASWFLSIKPEEKNEA